METIYKLPEDGGKIDVKFNEIVQSLVELNRLKDYYSKIYVPSELVGIVDQGESPDVYFVSMLEHTKEMNAAINGRIKNLKLFKKKLVERLGENAESCK